MAKGVVTPLNRVVYPAANVRKAFRLFLSSKSKGRVLVKINKSDLQKHVALLREPTYSEGTSIVISNTSDLGIELVDRLVNRGAKNIVLNYNVQSGYLQSWSKLGVNVSLSSKLLVDEDCCRTFIRDTITNGPIHNIFIVEVISTLEKFKHSYQSKIGILSEISTELCSELKSFVVIALTSAKDKNENIIFELRKTCQLQRQKGLPTILYQVKLAKENTENTQDLLMYTSPKKISVVFKSLKTAIEQGRDGTFSMKDQQLSSDFLDKVATILGINNIDEYDGQISLKDFGINNILLQELKALIYKVYRLNYSLKHLQQMKFHSLKSLNDKYNKKENTKAGFDALFSYVDDDECRVVEPMVLMSTAYNKNVFDESRVEIDSNDTYLFMVPGFDGHHEVFKLLCNGIKIPAVTLQIGPDFQGDTVTEMAKRIMKSIKQTFNLKSKFYVLGYSFGVYVVLELASLMEQEGHVGIVYCLDSSPDALKIQLNKYLGMPNDDELQNEIIEHMYGLISGRKKDEIGQHLKNIQPWTSKLEYCIGKLRKIVGFSHEYMKYTIQGFYEKIKEAQGYEPKFKLQSELVLLRSTQSQGMSLAPDYGLSVYSVQPVLVFDIDSDFATAPYDYKIANIVNKLLDPQLLEQFKQRNLCDCYVIS